MKEEPDWHKKRLIFEAKVTLVAFVVAACSYLIKYVF